jgi:hypothetical protein
MTKPTVCVVLCLLGLVAGAARAEAQLPPPPPAQPRPGLSATPAPDVPQPPPAGPGLTARGARGAVPQGFSVVLVLGDIQSAASSDDVPLAARKALTDMKDFLPFKSYRLLDAAWVMCCGQVGNERRPGSQNSGSLPPQTLSQMLRGPDEQEYELKLSSRMENSQVMVRFTLFGSPTGNETISDAPPTRATIRRIADLKDQATLLEKTIQETKKKVDVGVVSGENIPKMEVDLRRTNREIEELTTRLAETRAGRPAARAGSAAENRNSIIDTSFAMNVGETVVVGTSRLKGGSKALIALLTAVPPRASTDRREH